MKVDETELSENEISCIKKAVKDRQPIDFFCYTLTPDQKIRFQKILAIFLEECNQMYLYNYLTYCLFELLDNGSKANAKRIFFQEHHLDINNEDDYKNGMKTFKETLLENTLHYQEKLKAGELRVHLLLTANDVISELFQIIQKLQILNMLVFRIKLTKLRFIIQLLKQFQILIRLKVPDLV